MSFAESPKTTVSFLSILSSIFFANNKFLYKKLFKKKTYYLVHIPRNAGKLISLSLYNHGYKDLHVKKNGVYGVNNFFAEKRDYSFVPLYFGIKDYAHYPSHTFSKLNPKLWAKVDSFSVIRDPVIRFKKVLMHLATYDDKCGFFENEWLTKKFLLSREGVECILDKKMPRNIQEYFVPQVFFTHLVKKKGSKKLVTSLYDCFINLNDYFSELIFEKNVKHIIYFDSMKRDLKSIGLDVDFSEKVNPQMNRSLNIKNLFTEELENRIREFYKIDYMLLFNKNKL